MKTVILGEQPPEIAAFGNDAYGETGARPLLGVTAKDLVSRIDWPS